MHVNRALMKSRTASGTGETKGTKSNRQKDFVNRQCWQNVKRHHGKA
ncbi:hypothetical protein C7S13_2369 [Burkholderia cepacia]|nr:hypothetical protein [Burkholderia cepacia]MDW9242287.1 hypothetical protein [Burkholderia cepacia]QOH33640.1 hypothetical protein C7S14_5380 [Burkholderia cepacia]